MDVHEQCLQRWMGREEGATLAQCISPANFCHGISIVHSARMGGQQVVE